MHGDFSDLAIFYGLPLARACLAAVFLYSGQDKLRRWEAGVQEVADLGYGPVVNKMLAKCDKEVAKGPWKPDIWTRAGF